MHRLKSALAAAVSIVALSGASLAADLELKRVMLSSGGVGYFEYQTKVTGTETVEVPVRLDQMDDVLKSIVVFDDKGGGGVIETQGRDSLTEIFRTMPIGPDAFASPAALIASLQGEMVTVEQPVSASGRIVSVTEETTTTESGQTSTRHRVTLLTSSGLVSFLLEEARSLSFSNMELNGKVTEALAAIASNRQREGRTLRVEARGEGERTLTIGYVVEAPLWKTSYRLVTDASGATRMQGWAVLENASGADWRDVELTLVSGNPVTFRQALYQTYYVERPEVPVEVLGRILPKPDEGGVEMKDGDAEERAAMVAPAPPPPPPAVAEPAPMPADAAITVTGSSVGGGMPTDTERAIAASSQEAATQVVFTLPGRVTAGSGQTLAVPMIDRNVSAERIALFDPNVHGRNPMASIRLTNDTESGLPPGVLTLFDTGAGSMSYVGDARMNTLPQGDKRLLSFALDQKVIVDTSGTESSTLVSAKIANGVIETLFLNRSAITYTVKGPANEPRKVLIETPRRYDMDLKTPAPEGLELTSSGVRIPVELAAGETKPVEVVWERTISQTYGLADLDAYSIQRFIENDKLSAEQRAAFEKLAAMRSEIDRLETEIQNANAERDRLFQEQQRIRENLAAVPENSDLQRRYLQTLTEQEDRLQALAQRINDLTAQIDAARKALGDYVGGLTL